VAEGGFYTVGHSTRPFEVLLHMLRANDVEALVDVRTVLRSRHNPQYSQENLAPALVGAGIEYRHEPRLGGLRRPQRDSINTAWRNDSFRGYADYMQTPEFAAAVDEVVALGHERRIAMMCAEGNPFRCHRSLLADALIARGEEVFEIQASGAAARRQLTSFARVDGRRVWYPG
jgi:uncharacterized protein (DUF488 family)